MLQGQKSAWDKLSGESKEQVVESTLTTAFEAAKNKTLLKGQSILAKWYDLMVDYTEGEEYASFMSKNMDWIPNRIAAKVATYGYQFEYKLPDDPTDNTPDNTPDNNSSTDIESSTGKNPVDWKLWAGIALIASAGAYFIYSLIKKKN